MNTFVLRCLLAGCLLLATGGAALLGADDDQQPLAPASGSDQLTEAVTTAVRSSVEANAVATTAPATQPAPTSQRPEVIEKYLQYYFKMYGKHLKSGDWMARVMGIISLARIDDPRATEMLMDMMRKTGEKPIVQIYAWEALHGRQTRLAAEQRAEWVKTGLRFFESNWLRGDLRLPIVGLIEEGGPTTRNKARFAALFAMTNSYNPSDIRTLWAMGDLLARWRNKRLLKGLIESMSDLNSAYRAELILRRITTSIPHSHTLYRQSSSTMWGTTQRRWADWFLKQQFSEVEPNQGPMYQGLSAIMPHGEKIVDTADPKWRKDLELRRFRLDQLDVGIALDTTASMARPLEWVKRDVVKMMRMFALISREPRIGVTLYRDYGDRYVVKNIPLSGDAGKLSAALRPETYRGGGDIPEAVLEALVAMIRHQPWSTGTNAKRIIVLVSDAPPQQKTLEDIEGLCKWASRKKGFRIHTVKVRTSRYIERVLHLPNYDPQLTTFDKIAEWGQGKSMWVQFWVQSAIGRWRTTANPPNDEESQRVLFREVLRSALEEGYRDRVNAFVDILLEYVEEPLKETRIAFGPAGRGGGGGPPTNPQSQR
ncbi:MAG TPA: vWA domain-containing protein [Phycisphaerae bacterium]|nr:vWA domain-containing protein [Phycisphaerae bacterium]